MTETTIDTTIDAGAGTPASPFTMLGDAAGACEGDSCAIPEHSVYSEHPEHAIVARRLDADEV